MNSNNGIFQNKYQSLKRGFKQCQQRQQNGQNDQKEEDTRENEDK